MIEEQVVLVDTHDEEIGVAPKLAVHVDGRLHRAISVFVFNEAGELLLQRRAEGKYHSGGLWSNTCCSHPRPGEQPDQAARRRLMQEMGIAPDLEHAFAFIYRAEVHPDLIEHELDHVFIGRSGSDPAPDPSEVAEWRWASIDTIRSELASDAGRFTPWFPIAFEELLARSEVERWSPRATDAGGESGGAGRD